MPVLKQFFDKRRHYKPCIPADIKRHFDKIKHWIPDEEKEEFQKRMLACIKEGDAWCTDNTFLYYTRENLRISIGVAIFGMKYPMEILSLFIGIFSFEDHDTHIIRFKLHPGKFMEEYKTLLTMTSIRRTHINPNHPLLIRVDDFKKKIVKMLNHSGIKR